MTKVEQIKLALGAAVDADLDHGVQWVNEQMTREFAVRYPNINQVIHNILEMNDEEERTD